MVPMLLINIFLKNSMVKVYLMTSLKTIRQYLALTASALVLFSSILVFNFIQCLLFVTVNLFSQGFFQKLNRIMADYWWSLCVYIMVYGGKIKVDIVGDELDSSENAFLVSNHQAMTDITALFFVAKKYQRLGDLKWFVKDPIKYFPGIGWGLLFLNNIFLKRSWSKDSVTIKKTFQKIKRLKIPFWLISFVEGTRLTPKKRDESNAGCLKNGHKPFKNVQPPRTKGFIVTYFELKEELGAIYDVTIAYPEFHPNFPSLKQLFLGEVKHITLKVDRFPIATLPSTEPALEKWLFERYYVKDAWLEDYYAKH
jgi:1-acyl-sn-glycerol-3-phosphate acyltransferase